MTDDSLVNNSDISLVSNIIQIDGNVSCDSSSSSDSESGDSDDSNVTNYDTEDELEPANEPINITPPQMPSKRKQKILKASSLPLVAVMNARSLHNKADNFKTFMKELLWRSG